MTTNPSTEHSTEHSTPARQRYQFVGYVAGLAGAIGVAVATQLPSHLTTPYVVTVAACALIVALTAKRSRAVGVFLGVVTPAVVAVGLFVLFAAYCGTVDCQFG